MTDVAQGSFRHDDGLTVEAYLRRWLEEKDQVLRATTLRDYQRYVDTHLITMLGDVRLRDLRTPQISGMLRGLTEQGTGATSVRRIHAVLRSALADAVRSGLVRANAASTAIVVKRSRPKVNPWSAQELGAFLDHAATDEWGSIFELIAGAGLRRGEALGLRWDDVDLRQGVLVIRQQVVQLDGEVSLCPTCGGRHRGLAFTPPKTASGEARRIELGQAAAGVLLAHRLEQDEARTSWGSAYADHGLVFAQEDGNPIHPERLTKRFGALVTTSGLRRTRLHDLRHARASLLLASGTDLALVSKMLGHSSVAVTADTYSHLLEGVGRKAADAADALVPRRPRAHSVHTPAPGHS
jgi:integrase